MDMPCKHCDETIEFLKDEILEPWCDDPCEKYIDYTNSVSKRLDELFADCKALKEKLMERGVV